MPRKKPEQRSEGSKSTGVGDDPRFIEVSRVRHRNYTGPIPTPAGHWRPQTRSWFNSLSLSAQSDLYEPSDWATAVAAAEAYDIFLRTHNASILGSFVRLSERLGVCVSDRKRSRIEMEPPDTEDEDETAADKAVQGWQARLTVVR